jgi:hypothetical protein
MVPLTGFPGRNSAAFSRACTIALLALAPLSTTLQDAVASRPSIRSERVIFARGSNTATIRASIRGSNSVSYLVHAKAGQNMRARLVSAHRALYFNIYTPGKGPGDEALYISSLSENSFSGTLPESGDYTVSVYLFRSSARRNESATYRLEIDLEDGPGAATPSSGTLKWPPSHDASGKLRCTNMQEQSNTWCDFQVRRSQNGATIWTVRPDNPQALRVLYFMDSAFSTDDTSNLKWSREGDNWRVMVGKYEMYIIPDAALYGD